MAGSKWREKKSRTERYKRFFFLFPFFFWLLVLPVGRANRQANKCRKVFYLNEFSGIIHNNKTTVTTTTVAFSARILPFSSSKATHTQEEEKNRPLIRSRHTGHDHTAADGKQRSNKPLDAAAKKQRRSQRPLARLFP